MVAEALRAGLSHDAIHTACKFDPWYLEQLQVITDAEKEVRADGLPDDFAGLLRLKRMGFGDERLAALAGLEPGEVAARRHDLGVLPVFKRIDTCAAEFDANTPYMYSCYETGTEAEPAECESEPTDARKIIILGGGPNRIGQGIEFDYCCVHAAFSLSEAGFETTMVNCNPETVSTDYDTADRLYFEPLTIETVLDIVRVESSAGEVVGLNVQFGGQTPLKLARALEAAGVPILGTKPDAIDLAEDRDRFRTLLQELGLKQPANGTCTSTDQAGEIAASRGVPGMLVERAAAALLRRRDDLAAKSVQHAHRRLVRLREELAVHTASQHGDACLRYRGSCERPASPIGSAAQIGSERLQAGETCRQPGRELASHQPLHPAA